MADLRRYTVPETFDLELLSQTLLMLMSNDLKLETQRFRADGGVILQGREQNTVKRYIGMDRAMTVKLSLSDEMLSVDVGHGKWLDKAAGAGLALLFWPAAVTVAIGSVQQAQMPGRIFACVEDTLSLLRKKEASTRTCEHCGSAISEGDMFCRKCGERM